MKKLLILAILGFGVYYFVFTDNEQAVNTIDNVENSENALDFDKKYQKAVDDFEKANAKNMEKVNAHKEFINNLEKPTLNKDEIKESLKKKVDMNAYGNVDQQNEIDRVHAEEKKQKTKSKP